MNYQGGTEFILFSDLYIKVFKTIFRASVAKLLCLLGAFAGSKQKKGASGDVLIYRRTNFRKVAHLGYNTVGDFCVPKYKRPMRPAMEARQHGALYVFMYPAARSRLLQVVTLPGEADVEPAAGRLGDP